MKKFLDTCRALVSSALRRSASRTPERWNLGTATVITTEHGAAVLWTEII